jgi:uncharacterized Zn-finger protein
MASSVEGVRAPLRGDEPRPRHDDEDAEGEQALDEADDTQPRKKRRVIQSSDKKYICPAEGCGKRYSRNEHLYRHQLNRTSTKSRESRYFNISSDVEQATSEGTTLD